NYTPSNLTFFTDADLPGQRIADAIAKSSGARVEQHNNHFGRRTEDVDWLPYVGRRDWVVVTADKRIKRRLFERETLINAGVRSFVLGSGNLGVQAIIAILTTAMPAMLKLIAEQDPHLSHGLTKPAKSNCCTQLNKRGLSRLDQPIRAVQSSILVSKL